MLMPSLKRHQALHIFTDMSTPSGLHFFDKPQGISRVDMDKQNRGQKLKRYLTIPLWPSLPTTCQPKRCAKSSGLEMPACMTVYRLRRLDSIKTSRAQSNWVNRSRQRVAGVPMSFNNGSTNALPKVINRSREKSCLSHFWSTKFVLHSVLKMLAMPAFKKLECRLMQKIKFPCIMDFIQLKN